MIMWAEAQSDSELEADSDIDSELGAELQAGPRLQSELRAEPTQVKPMLESELHAEQFGLVDTEAELHLEESDLQVESGVVPLTEAHLKTLTIEKLRKLLREQKKDTSGKKDVLIQRVLK